MAKKQEDNRDVFDKVFDVAVPVASGYIGMVGGRRLGGSKKRAMKYLEEGREATRARDALVTKTKPKQGDVEEALWQNNKRGWAYDDGYGILQRRIYGGMAGGVAGAITGMGANIKHNDVTKRRRK